MRTSEEWYQGSYAEYAIIPWFYELDTRPLMPWIVLEIHPCGYIVFMSNGGTKFKMLNKPVIVVGDVVQ